MIPIIINNFNRLTTTKKLVEDLKRLGYDEIFILDNNSSYPPLLEWYDTNPCNIFRFNQNFGPRCLWDSGIISQFQQYKWVAYTDSDIELSQELFYPRKSHLLRELEIMGEFYGYNKVGLALKIDDLPNNEYARTYKNWEARFWTNEVSPYTGIYKAEIDTTFAIIKPQLPFQYEAIRAANEFTARHVPWYTNFNHLDEEEKYYLEHANNTSTYKNFYNTHIKNQINE